MRCSAAFQLLAGMLADLPPASGAQTFHSFLYRSNEPKLTRGSNIASRPGAWEVESSRQTLARGAGFGASRSARRTPR